MYERNPVDNNARCNQIATPAELALDDGRILKGRFHITSTRPIFEVLNGSNLFLDFEQHTGQRELIAKSTIRAIKLISVPKSPSLDTKHNQNDRFDPHSILGVSKNAEWAEIREAYHQRSKTYHPDRYASADLPKEVADYLNTMSRRINAAFAALDQSRETRSISRPVKPKSEPVFTSQPRS